MTRLLDENLDEYTRFAVLLILAAFPDWARYATVTPNADGTGACVTFEVPCPNPNAEMGLIVSTENHELTVGFDVTHRHFADYSTPCNPERVTDGIEWAREFLDERRLTVSWYDGDRWCGSGSVETPGSGCVGQWSQSTTRYRFRSWTGRYDREVTV